MREQTLPHDATRSLLTEASEGIIALLLAVPTVVVSMFGGSVFFLLQPLRMERHARPTIAADNTLMRKKQFTPVVRLGIVTVLPWTTMATEDVFPQSIEY